MLYMYTIVANISSDKECFVLLLERFSCTSVLCANKRPPFQAIRCVFTFKTDPQKVQVMRYDLLKVLICVHIYEPNYICCIDILVKPFISIPFTLY